MNTSFTISILGLLILSGIAYRGTDTSGAVVALISAYVASEAAKRSSHIWASSKDPNCDTREAIRDIEHIDK